MIPVLPTAERPPYVTFEYRAVEDRNATLAKGKPVYNDVPFIIVTPHSSKDRLEFEAEQWFKDRRVDAEAGRFRPDWIAQYEAAFEAWKKGEEPVLDGTPIRMWPGVLPSQMKVLLALNIRTVEDLAQANESALQAIGMGSRILKERAQHYLAQAGGTQMASALAEMQNQLRESQTQIAKLLEDNKAMAQALLEVAPNRVPRPARVEPEENALGLKI